MSYGSQTVRYNGSTATFHRNKSTDLKGFVYSGGRRVYGRLHTDVGEGLAPIFVANGAAEPVLASV